MATNVTTSFNTAALPHVTLTHGGYANSNTSATLGVPNGSGGPSDPPNRAERRRQERKEIKARVIRARNDRGDPLGNFVAGVGKRVYNTGAYILSWGSAPNYDADPATPEPFTPEPAPVHEAAMQELSDATPQQTFWDTLYAVGDFASTTVSNLAHSAYDATNALGAYLPSIGPEGADAAAATSAPASASGTPTLTTFSKAIAKLAQNDVTKFIVGEGHNQPRNLATITATIEGAQQAGESLSFYREINIDNLDHWKEVMNDFNQRSNATELLFLAINNQGNTNPEGAEARKFTSVLADESVNPKLVSVHDPKNTGLSDFVYNKGLAVLSIGASHPLCAWMQPNQVDCPSIWGVRRISIAEQRVPPLTPDKQKDNFNAFQRAMDQAPTALIIQSQFWSKKENREVFYNHMSRRGDVFIAEAKFGRGNVTIVAPKSALPDMQKFAQENPRTFFLIHPEPIKQHTASSNRKQQKTKQDL